jgi:hypothetical protein
LTDFCQAFFLATVTGGISILDHSISSWPLFFAFGQSEPHFIFREHTAIVIMSGTASNVGESWISHFLLIFSITSFLAIGMEIIAALDLFYDLRLNAAVAIFQIFATQMVGYGIAGICE